MLSYKHRAYGTSSSMVTLRRKDRMALVAICQAVSKDILLMLAAWETLQTMHVGVERVKEAKVQTLKSEFEAIRMKDGESIDDFAMKLTMIVSNIHPLGDVVEEISVVKKFLRAFPQGSSKLLPLSSSSATSRTCRLRRSLVILRSMRRDFVATKTKRRINTSYSYMRSGSHEQKERCR